MRYIAIFLVLLNIIYLVWSNMAEESEELAPEEPRPLLNTGIITLAEFATDTERQQALNAQAEQLCTLVSGFQTLDDAEYFIADARGAGHLAALQLLGEELSPLYRLYLPPASSRAVATITLDGLGERLKEENLDVESYLITRGLLENAVALGVYEDEQRARELLERIQGLGYGPTVDVIPRSTGGIEVWLHPGSDQRLNDSEWLDLSTERPGLSRSENLCETLVQAPQFQ